MFPIARRELWQGFNAHCIIPQGKELHSVEAKFDSRTPLMEVVCKGISLKGVLVDGRIGTNVMTNFTMEILGLWYGQQSKVKLKMATNNKVKSKGVVMAVSISVFGIITTLDFQVIQNEVVAYPMILGRWWLKRAHVQNYWKKGFMKIGVSPNWWHVFMDGRKVPKVEELSSDDGSSNLKRSTTEIEIDTNEFSSDENVDYLVYTFRNLKGFEGEWFEVYECVCSIETMSWWILQLAKQIPIRVVLGC